MDTFVLESGIFRYSYSPEEAADVIVAAMAALRALEPVVGEPQVERARAILKDALDGHEPDGLRYPSRERPA
jgi:hypothetical protein